MIEDVDPECTRRCVTKMRSGLNSNSDPFCSTPRKLYACPGTGAQLVLPQNRPAELTRVYNLFYRGQMSLTEISDRPKEQALMILQEGKLKGRQDLVIRAVFMTLCGVVGWWCRYLQILNGSLSAVSTPIFANKYSLE